MQWYGKKFQLLWVFISIIMVVPRWKICTFIFFIRVFKFLKFIVFRLSAEFFWFWLPIVFCVDILKKAIFRFFNPTFFLKIWKSRSNLTIRQISSHFGIQEHFKNSIWRRPLFLAVFLAGYFSLNGIFTL